MTLEEWCSKTSLHGVSDLLQSKSQKWRLCFWLTVMLVMCGLMIMFIALNIINFVKSPTMINIETVPNSNLEAPELLVCYNGGINVAALKKKNFSDDVIKAIQNGFITKDESLDYDILLFEFRENLRRLHLSNEDFYRKIVGYSCEEIVESRKKAGDVTQESKCDDVSYFVGKFGKPCLVFKNNGHQQWPTPSTGGIRISLRGPNGSHPLDFNDLGLMHSFDLVVEKHVVIATDQSVEIPLNYKTNVLISLTESIRLQKNKPCDADTTFTTSNACYQRCYNRGAEKHCNCSLPGMTPPGYPDSGIPLCDVFYYHSVCSKISDMWEEGRKCSKSCLPICKEYLYTTTVSHVPITNANNSAKITIAYSHQQYSRIEEVDAFTWDVVVSNIGGQFGLWMGCSIVTIIQAIFYFCLHVCHKTTKSSHIQKLLEVQKAKRSGRVIHPVNRF